MTKSIALLLAGLTAAIIAARWLHALTLPDPAEFAIQPWTQERLEFVTWNDEQWMARLRQDQFVLTPQEASRWSRHANPTLAYISWDGEKWQAKIEGDEFLLAQRGNWQGTVERSSAIRYRDWLGRKQLRTVAQLRR